MEPFLSIIFFDSLLADARRRLPDAAGRDDQRPRQPADRPSRFGLRRLRP